MNIPFNRLEAAIHSDECLGFCLSCGEEAYGVEPDARAYVCESCRQKKVYGAEEILIMGCVDMSDAANEEESESDE